MKESIKQFRVIGAAEVREAKKENVELEQDKYLDKVKKYIPTEVVLAYVFLQQTIENSASEVGGFWTKDVLYGVIFFICLIVTPIYKYMQVNDAALSKPIRQLVISTLAFIVWVFYFGDWFELLLGKEYYSTVLATILMVSFTLTTPILEYVTPIKNKIPKTIALIAISMTCWNSYAQQSILLSGGWKVNEQHPFTCITDGNLLTAKRFRITNTTLVNGDPVKFQIHNDGGTYTAILPEGGGMIIDSKALAISQLNAGSSFQGNWEVLDDTVGFHQVSWNAYPTQTERVLLGAFDNETMFTLTINKSQGCSGGLMLIYVDDKVVTDSKNQPLQFLEGNSIAGFGKKVEVKVTGTCTGENSFGGTLKIEK